MPMHTTIVIKPAGRRVLPSEPDDRGFWQLTLGGTVVGWATSYSNALAKAERLEQARQAPARPQLRVVA
ncbi:hypothetical protein SAMN05216421_1077 [Halopseudomonas xinjiangensis]|uniref:Uncharacterized protein n=1 Tax=Halopseudomonas xinjiangensis TaxID=487184 RepID=A0A1H1Q829_9GAMM|nr:hypothetical protein [Halopseudomonas xinjiangensis]SDS19483.1 hypothetical protein SAMN05216421_1077 [Halopseudomonas xinjiangensis]